MSPIDADITGVVVSHPKSGRTWLRFMLAHALSGAPVETLRDCAVAVPDVEAGRSPTGVAVSHEPRRLDEAPHGVVLLRDPGEILVSFFFHATEHRTVDRFTGSFAAFVDSDLGVSNLAAFLGGVGDRLDRGVEIVTYDALLADPASTLGRVIEACGRTVSPERVAAAVEAGRIDSMRSVEASEPINQRFDAARPNRNRVRSGRADRGVTLLTDDDRLRIRRRLRRELGADAARLRDQVPSDWAL